MKPFDDSIPEEVELQQRELLALLQRAYRRPVPMTPTEQEQILGRVKERLLNFPEGMAEEDAIVNAPAPPPVGVGVGKGILVVAHSRRTRVFQLLNRVAAVLVLGAIVGASLLLFSHGPHGEPGTTVTEDGTALAAHSSAGGLEMSLSLTPGPYFLSEMLAADISLTNHSKTTYYVGIPFVGSPCGYATGVAMTGGGAPHYQIPISTDHSCPGGFDGRALKPGQTVTARKYLPLTDSGHLTLTAETTFLTRKVDNVFDYYTSVSGPFDRHWPTAQINVNSSIRADRQLSFKIQGTHVIVTAPQGAQLHLLYLYGVSCQDFHDAGSTGTGNYGWEAISTNQVNVPGCPGKNVQWSFAFSAPGYATVVGNYPPTANHQ
jgi:hypothetical protein